MLRLTDLTMRQLLHATSTKPITRLTVLNCKKYASVCGQDSATPSEWLKLGLDSVCDTLSKYSLGVRDVLDSPCTAREYAT